MAAYKAAYTNKEAAITPNVGRMKGLSKDGIMARIQQLLYSAEKSLSNTNGAIYDKAQTVRTVRDAWEGKHLLDSRAHKLSRVNKVQGILGKRARYLKRFKYITKLIK